MARRDEPVTVAVVGLGYFSQFHLRSWAQMDGANLIAGCDPNDAARASAEQQFGIASYQRIEDLLASHQLDIIDIVAPPTVHCELIERTAAADRLMICQKPFCTSLEQARHAADLVTQRGARLVIHENFRFQPWHRRIKRFIEDGDLGQIYHCQFLLRPGDGRGADAYLARQPFFQQMPRFLIRETGVHFIDLFRWLFGNIKSVYADLWQLNPVLAGEDSGVLIMTHENGVRSVFDGNRLVDHVADNQRLTMGEMQISGEKGSLRLDGFGKLYFRAFDSATEKQIDLDVPMHTDVFGGGCVDYLNRSALTAFRKQDKYENEISDYLDVIKVAELAYESASSGKRMPLR